MLLEKLSNIHKENKDFQPHPSSPTTQNNGGNVEGNHIDHQVIQSSDVINATSHSNEASLLVLGSSDESGEANLIPTIDICNEAMTISDTKDNYSVILKELSLIKSEMREIKENWKSVYKIT